MSIDRVSKYLTKLGELFQSSPLRNQAFQGFPTDDKSVAFCVAKDLIQDTLESWLCINERSQQTRSISAYIEFWGVLQTVVIQQDAIDEMHWAVVGSKLPQSIKRRPGWKSIRDIRNELAGHPVNSSFGKVRTSIARPMLSYCSAFVEKYETKTGKYSHQTILLKDHLESYYRVAAIAIYLIWRSMRTRW